MDRIYHHKIDKSKFSDGFLYYFSRDIVKSIRETEDPQVVSKWIKEIYIRDADIWSRSNIFLQSLPFDRFVYGFANPDYKDVKSFFARFGYTKYHNDMQARLKVDFLACTNMVKHIVDERNKIAHGDSSVTGTANDVGDMSRYVQMFCRATDDVVADWFKTHKCVLRTL